MSTQPSRQTALYTLAGLFAIGVLLAGWLWLNPPSDDGRSPDESATSQSAAPALTDDECPDDLPESTSVPTSGPDVEWQIYRRVPLPHSAVHGPHVVAGDIATCYSRTPEGALIAIIHASTRTLITTEPRAVNEAMAEEGPGRSRRVELFEEQGYREPKPGELCTLVGFQFIDYTPDRANIVTASQCPSGAIQQINQAASWDGQTWLLHLEADGSSGALPSAIPNLDGLIPWGGV